MELNVQDLFPLKPSFIWTKEALNSIQQLIFTALLPVRRVVTAGCAWRLQRPELGCEPALMLARQPGIKRPIASFQHLTLHPGGTSEFPEMDLWNKTQMPGPHLWPTWVRISRDKTVFFKRSPRLKITELDEMAKQPIMPWSSGFLPGYTLGSPRELKKIPIPGYHPSRESDLMDLEAAKVLGFQNCFQLVSCSAKVEIHLIRRLFFCLVL